MKVSKEELLHIADLADLNLNEEEVDNYVEILEEAPIKDLQETIGANDNSNVFRKDEVKVFEDHDALLSNAPEVERDMLKIPKVIN